MSKAPWLFVAVLAATPSCKSASGSLPGWENGAESEPPEGEVAALTVASPTEEGPVGGASSEGDADPATQDGGPEAGGPDASSTAEGGAGKNGPGPLPKPINAKVDRSCGQDPGVGQRLKGFALKTPEGKTIKPSMYRGRVLLVNFWGTWCKPCLQELPEFDHLYRRYRKHGLTLVAVATDEDAGPVKEIVKSKKLSAKVVIGGESYANGYGSDKFPFSFVVDPAGVIKASYRGYKPECAGKLEADIRAELEKRNE